MERTDPSVLAVHGDGAYVVAAHDEALVFRHGAAYVILQLGR